MPAKSSAHDPLGPLTETRHLGKAAARGTALTLVTAWAGFVLQLISTFFIARLVNPDDYGIVAMVTSITGLAEVLKDLGLGAATVQRRDITDREVNAVFWINAGLGAIVATVVACLAPLIAAFYDKPELVPVTLALALPFVFTGFIVQHQALMERQLRFRTLTKIDLTSRATGVSVSIALALAGWGYWALVVGVILRAFSRSVMTWLDSYWKPAAPSSPASMIRVARGSLTFGGYLSVVTVTNYASRNVDNVLIGQRYDDLALGLYVKAYQLLLLPLQQVNAPFGKVAIPTLARLRDDAVRFRKYYRTAMTLIGFVVVPLIILMAVLATEMVRLALGDEYLGAARIFQALALAGIAQTLSSTNGWLFTSTGRSKQEAAWTLVKNPVIIASFFIGLPYGPYGVAVAYAVANWILLVPGYALAVRDTHVRLRDVVAALRLPLVISGAFTVAILLAHERVERYGPMISTLVTVGVGACLYAGLIAAWPAARREWALLPQVARTAIGGRGKKA